MQGELRERIPVLYVTKNDADPIVQAKLFTPWTTWTWFVTEFDGQDTCLGLISGHEAELGDFNLAELEPIEGPGALRIERDLHFQPQPLSKVREDLKQMREGPDGFTAHENGAAFNPRANGSVSVEHGTRKPPAPIEQPGIRRIETRLDIYGNWNRAVQGAFRLGVRGHLTHLTRLNDWNEVADWLAQGTPVIASIGVQPGQLRGAPYAQTAGHRIVICGLDGAGNAIVQDPAVPAGELGTRSYAFEDLDQVWLRRGGFAYILGRLPWEPRR